MKLIKQLLVTLLLLTCAGGSLYVAVIGYLGLRTELQLRNDGKEITATVTGSRISQQSRRHSFDIQYVFTTDNQDYTFSDATGRRDLWAGMPKHEWEKAKSLGEVAVIYVQSNPWINRPRDTKGEEIGDSIAAIVLFGLVGLVFSIVSVGNMRKYFRR